MPWRLGCEAVVLARGAMDSAAPRDITSERLRDADKEPQNWLVYGGPYRSLRHNLLAHITTPNVHRLQAAWAFQVGTID